MKTTCSRSRPNMDMSSSKKTKSSLSFRRRRREKRKRLPRRRKILHPHPQKPRVGHPSQKQSRSQRLGRRAHSLHEDRPPAQTPGGKNEKRAHRGKTHEQRQEQ